MSCLGDDDVVRDATIEQISQVVFSASLLRALRDYISQRTKLNPVSAGMSLNSSKYGSQKKSVCSSAGVSSRE
jgi:hypothetical protein